MKKMKYHLRMLGYILLILLASVGLSFGGAVPVLLRNKKPKKKKPDQTEEVIQNRETDEQLRDEIL